MSAPTTEMKTGHCVNPYAFDETDLEQKGIYELGRCPAFLRNEEQAYPVSEDAHPSWGIATRAGQPLAIREMWDIAALIEDNLNLYFN